MNIEMKRSDLINLRRRKVDKFDCTEIIHRLSNEKQILIELYESTFIKKEILKAKLNNQSKTTSNHENKNPNISLNNLVLNQECQENELSVLNNSTNSSIDSDDYYDIKTPLTCYNDIIDDKINKSIVISHDNSYIIEKYNYNSDTLRIQRIEAQCQTIHRDLLELKLYLVERGNQPSKPLVIEQYESLLNDKVSIMKDDIQQYTTDIKQLIEQLQTSPTTDQAFGTLLYSILFYLLPLIFVLLVQMWRVV